MVVIAADVTNLKNRGIAFAWTSSPYMITAFAGSKAAEGFLKNVSWRWGFGAFAIIVPIVALPIYLVLKLNLRKAEKQGLLSPTRQRSGRTLVENIKYWFFELDCR
jgi:MFS family permease